MFLFLWLTLLVIVTNCVSSVSTATWTEMAWQLWTRVAPSASIRQLRETRQELMKVRLERSKTSSQDEFAKWARLDREHQKCKKAYDLKNAEVAATRTKMTSTIRLVKWVFTQGLLWAVQWSLRKEPVIWLPHRALPTSLEWFLALPKAPSGSVSAATWIMATNTAVKTVTSLVQRSLVRYRVRAAKLEK